MIECLPDDLPRSSRGTTNRSIYLIRILVMFRDQLLLPGNVFEQLCAEKAGDILHKQSDAICPGE